MPLRLLCHRKHSAPFGCSIPWACGHVCWTSLANCQAVSKLQLEREWELADFEEASQIFIKLKTGQAPSVLNGAGFGVGRALCGRSCAAAIEHAAAPLVPTAQPLPSRGRERCPTLQSKHTNIYREASAAKKARGSWV